MYDGGKIILGLLLFLVIVTFPIWYNVAVGQADYHPELEFTTKDVPGKDQCVMPADEMVTEHMDLLNQWRDQVVRENSRVYEAHNGIKYNKSLTSTCLDCHSKKDVFCDRCHNYMGVDPYCWDCHIIPEEVKP